MATSLTDIRNIGPAMADALQNAGIRSGDELRELGADKAYRQLVEHGHRPHFIAYYALVMGLQGRPWNDCQGAEKKALREQFDKIVATEANPVPAIVQALDDVGVLVNASQLVDRDSDD